MSYLLRLVTWGVRPEEKTEHECVRLKSFSVSIPLLGEPSLLLEQGGYFLLESGGKLELE